MYNKIHSLLSYNLNLNQSLLTKQILFSVNYVSTMTKPILLTIKSISKLNVLFLEIKMKSYFSKNKK